ncbi:hypothetical protein F5Y01DRAFT_327810 [Xylaria sp. FL0043]|nr:hypothetical protein F5Y01DRAFT_327810 [Xylaria sp. FL0043]
MRPPILLLATSVAFAHLPIQPTGSNFGDAAVVDTADLLSKTQLTCLDLKALVANTNETNRMSEYIDAHSGDFISRSQDHCGGHDFNVNHSSVAQGGILIDLVNLNSISLSNDKAKVTAGSSVRWGSVHQALSGSGVSVNGARSPNPGVGGQTLGGGIGWLTGIAGVTASSLVEAEIMLANSSILRITSHDPRANIVLGLSQSKSTPQSFVGFIYLDPVEYPLVFDPFYAISPAAEMLNSTIGTVFDLYLNFDTPQYPEPGTVPLR